MRAAKCGSCGPRLPGGGTEVIRQARVLADDGQFEDARYKLVEAHEALDNIVLDDCEKLVNLLRDDLQQLIKLMDTKETYEALGRAYALASETLHALHVREGSNRRP